MCRKYPSSIPLNSLQSLMDATSNFDPLLKRFAVGLGIAAIDTMLCCFRLIHVHII